MYILQLSWKLPSASRRRVLMYTVVLGALCASCSEAWVTVPTRGCNKSGRRWCGQPSSHRDTYARKRPSRGRVQPAVAKSGDDQTEGATPPSPLIENASVVAAEAGGSRAVGRSVSWQEQFASLLNDAADPWTAVSSDDSSSSRSSRSSGSAQVASLGISANEVGSCAQEQTATDGGAAAVGEEVKGVESQLAGTAVAAAVPEETGTSRLLLFGCLSLLSWFFSHGVLSLLTCC